MYNILSEDDVPIKLKIEVNTREHFSVYGLQDIPVKLDSEWDNGEALVTIGNQIKSVIPTEKRT